MGDVCGQGSTKDATIVRDCDVTKGSEWSVSSAEETCQWTRYDQNTWDYIAFNTLCVELIPSLGGWGVPVTSWPLNEAWWTFDAADGDVSQEDLIFLGDTANLQASLSAIYDGQTSQYSGAFQQGDNYNEGRRLEDCEDDDARVQELFDCEHSIYFAPDCATDLADFGVAGTAFGDYCPVQCGWCFPDLDDCYYEHYDVGGAGGNAACDDYHAEVLTVYASDIDAYDCPSYARDGCQSATDLATPEECQALCAANDECYYFVFETDDGVIYECFLKGAGDETCSCDYHYYEGGIVFISGPAVCGQECPSYAAPVTLQLEAAGTATLDVLIEDEDSNDIAGFQFDIEGAEITGADGGLAEEAGMDISASSSRVLGFSMSGATFNT